MGKLLEKRNGNIIVFTVIMLTALIGFTALVVDVGLMAYKKSLLQNACDAAALAGARELPVNTARAESTAIQYAVDNKALQANISVDFPDTNMITVEAEETVIFYFARIFGKNHGKVSAKATAMVGTLKKLYQGLRPFGVEDGFFVLGQQVVLKQGVWGASNGNFGILALDETGASTYKETVLYGAKTGYEVGDYVDTEPGNMVGPTIQAVNELIGTCHHTPLCSPDSYQMDCPRIIVVPLVDSLMVNGRTPVQILGFAAFFLEDVKNNGGKTQVTGTFIEKVAAGGADTGIIDYGVKAVRLIE